MNALRQVSSQMVLVPAYGRHYVSAQKMREDWEAGKDFKVYPNGPYTSVRDITWLTEDASSITLVDRDVFYKVA